MEERIVTLDTEGAPYTEIVGTSPAQEVITVAEFKRKAQVVRINGFDQMPFPVLEILGGGRPHKPVRMTSHNHHLAVRHKEPVPGTRNVQIRQVFPFHGDETDLGSILMLCAARGTVQQQCGQEQESTCLEGFCHVAVKIQLKN